MKHVIIVGNGIAGITAARNIRKNSNHRITVVSSEAPYFFSRTALMYVYMGHMKFEHTKPYEDWFWGKNRIELIHAHVNKADPATKELTLHDERILNYDILILATGSKPAFYNWPGQHLLGVSGLYSYQDLQYITRHTRGIKRSVIVGGGLIGVELAEMLHAHGIGVHFLVRESNFWNTILPEEESSLVARHIRSQGIDLRLRTELKEILSDDAGRVRAVITGDGEQIDCEFVGIATGVEPNIEMVRESPVHTDRGILVNEYLETNIPGVYAIGDCAQHQVPPPGRKSIEQVWYTGRMQGETVACTVCDNPVPYQPGTWFNSAKFFDIEYQTYGEVPREFATGKSSFYWENLSKDKCLRLVFDKQSGKLSGINALGIRLRHEIAEDFLREGLNSGQVVERLDSLGFDPEFHASTIREVATALLNDQKMYA